MRWTNISPRLCVTSERGANCGGRCFWWWTVAMEEMAPWGTQKVEMGKVGGDDDMRLDDISMYVYYLSICFREICMYRFWLLFLRSFQEAMDIYGSVWISCALSVVFSSMTWYFYFFNWPESATCDVDKQSGFDISFHGKHVDFMWSIWSIHVVFWKTCIWIVLYMDGGFLVNSYEPIQQLTPQNCPAWSLLCQALILQMLRHWNWPKLWQSRQRHP